MQGRNDLCLTAKRAGREGEKKGGGGVEILALENNLGIYALRQTLYMVSLSLYGSHT